MSVDAERRHVVCGKIGDSNLAHRVVDIRCSDFLLVADEVGTTLNVRIGIKRQFALMVPLFGKIEMCILLLLL